MSRVPRLAVPPVLVFTPSLRFASVARTAATGDVGVRAATAARGSPCTMESKEQQQGALRRREPASPERQVEAEEQAHRRPRRSRRGGSGGHSVEGRGGSSGSSGALLLGSFSASQRLK
eukprot:1115766-Prymnesium_polylepis.1